MEVSVPRKLAILGSSGSFAIMNCVQKTAFCQTDSATGKAHPRDKRIHPNPYKASSARLSHLLLPWMTSLVKLMHNFLLTNVKLQLGCK